MALNWGMCLPTSCRCPWGSWALILQLLQTRLGNLGSGLDWMVVNWGMAKKEKQKNIYIYMGSLGTARISPYSSFSFSFWSFKKDKPRMSEPEDHCLERNGPFSGKRAGDDDMIYWIYIPKMTLLHPVEPATLPETRVNEQWLINHRSTKFSWSSIFLQFPFAMPHEPFTCGCTSKNTFYGQRAEVAIATASVHNRRFTIIYELKADWARIFGNALTHESSLF